MQKRVKLVLLFTLFVLPIALGLSNAQQVDQDGYPDIRLFFEATAQEGRRSEDALRQIGGQWRVGYAGIIWDLARFVRPPGAQLFQYFRLMNFLEQQTGQQLGADLGAWQDWIWNQPYDPHPDYAFFKGQLYSQLDPLFEEFFPRGVESLIRLDEIAWGGVVVNGIPPLEYPKRLEAAAADYLRDDHIVFGIAIEGEARAYPKRILAWHEMALDILGGVELTIVYCTLCGTVIPFESVVDGRHLTFGTSGLLYRSNKLMFDHETRSLWNTFEGVPVVGSLIRSGLRLTPHAVVTTTWGEWRNTHPTTTVLSLDTGHRRDYSEGAAYRNYFSTDELMFQVSNRDDRLRNKEEVLVMLLDDLNAEGQRRPLAIVASLLQKNRVFHHRHAGRNLVIVTSAGGGNRVYDCQDVRFVRHLDKDKILDEIGRAWTITEEALFLDGDPSVRHVRVPAQRAFWFGWYAQFPDTILIG